MRDQGIVCATLLQMVPTSSLKNLRFICKIVGAEVPTFLLPGMKQFKRLLTKKFDHSLHGVGAQLCLKALIIVCKGVDQASCCLPANKNYEIFHSACELINLTWTAAVIAELIFLVYISCL